MTIRILLVDDHEMFRNGVRALLSNDAEIEVVGEAADGQSALLLAKEAKADVVCIDINMPALDGISVTRQIKQDCPNLRVIGVSALVDRSYVRDLMNAGAAGYVAKASAGEDLRKAIHAVYEGKTYVCPVILEILTEQMREQIGKGPNAMPQLGARELQVLRFIAEGLTSVEIGERMKIASSTVDVHRRNIMHKLGLRGIAELTRYAIRNGLVTPNV